jgi:hypothetical protein
MTDLASTAQATLRALQSNTHRQMYAGNSARQARPRFLAVDSPDDLPKHLPQYRTFEPAGPPLVKKTAMRQIRGTGPAAFGDGSDPHGIKPLDPLALLELKIKAPVDYHAYRNPRPYVRQSTVIGEFLRPGASSPQRVPTAPSAVPVGVSKRQALQALRSRSTTAIGAARRPGDMDAVSPTRQGLRPSGQREADDMTTLFKKDFIDPRTLPEPATCKATRFEDRPFYSKFPTDTSARDALFTMRNLDGTLVHEKPELVHPSIWRHESVRDKSLSLGNPHAHKYHGRPVAATAH